MSILKKGLSGLVVLILVLAAYFWWSNNQTPHYLPDRDIFEKLELENDSITQANVDLATQNQQLQIQSDSILLLLQKDHQVIQQLNQKKNEKIRAIDHYDHDELYLFFANYQLTTKNP